MIGRMMPAAVVATVVALAAPSTAWAQQTASQPKVDIDKYDKAIKSYQDAMKYYQSGQYKLAEKELNGFLESQGSHAGGNFLMGLVQVGLEDLEKARTSFKAALRIDDKMVAPRGYLGAIEGFLGNQQGVQEQKTALAKLKTECAGTCPKAGDIEQAIQRIEANAPAAAPAQPS